MANIIFDDLGIDYKSMMTDPDTFIESVYEAAENLKTILKKSDSIDEYIKTLPRPTDIDFGPFDKLLNEVWDLADTYPIRSAKELAEKLRKLASQLEFNAKERAVNEMVNSMNHTLDKATAHEQYVRLRSGFNEYVSAMETLGIKTGIQKLPAMPGNYGSPVGLVHYIFQFEGDPDHYRMHQSVCRRLNIDIRSLMDTVEYVQSHPETGCTVKKVTN